MTEQEIATAGSTTFENGVKSGRSHTEDGKRNISEGLKRRAKERKEGVDVNGKWTEFLLLRGARIQTIAEFSDLSDDKDKKDKESINFARELLVRGLISEDTTAWRFLDLHYRNNKRNFPAFFDMLRLEVFYKGIQEARRGDLTSINLYRDTGHMIDPRFDTNLADEEDYVAGLIDEKPAGMSEDRLGYFREDEYGRGGGPVASSGSGIIADSSMHSVSREIMRNFEPPKVR